MTKSVQYYETYSQFRDILMLCQRDIEDKDRDALIAKKLEEVASSSESSVNFWEALVSAIRAEMDIRIHVSHRETASENRWYDWRDKKIEEMHLLDKEVI